MSTITCLRELEERGELEELDIVEFIVKEEVIKYIVCFNHLWDKKHRESFTNNKIFKILEIDKKEITEKTYGYEPIKHNNNDRYFPEYRDNDFSAITRLVAELYKIIEKKEIIYTKFTRFEIMEI